MKNLILTLLFSCTLVGLFAQDNDKKPNLDFEAVKYTVYPIIKSKTSKSAKKAIKAKLIHKPIAGDLVCFYGVNMGTHFHLLSSEDLPEGTTSKELDKYTKDNLLSDVGQKLDIHQTVFGALGFTCGGNHEAALITIPAIWDVMKENFGNDITFIVPTKDLILFVDSNNTQAIGELKKIVKEVFKGDYDRLISKQIFNYKNGKISVLK